MSGRPLRILHVDKFACRRRGGAPSYMLDLVEWQRDQGHDVEFFASDGPTDTGGRYRHLFPPVPTFDPPPKSTASRARAIAHMVWSRRVATAIAQVLDDFQPSVVHLHNIYHQLSPSILGPIRRRRIRHVMTVHDYKLVCPTYRLVDGAGRHCEACVDGSVANVVRRRCQGGSRAESTVLMVESGLHRLFRAYGSIDGFLCPSRHMAELLGRRGLGARSHHLPLGYDIDSVPVRTSPGQGIAFGGRLVGEKGVGHLIEAVEQVPGLHLTVCGDGPDRERLEREAAVRLPGRHDFTGHIDREQLLAVFRASAAVAIPSVWVENQPIVALDAMASGVPVITSSTPALTELVPPGIAGLGADPREPTELATSIATLVGDPALQDRLGRAGRARVAEVHSVSRHLSALERIYSRSDDGVSELAGSTAGRP